MSDFKGLRKLHEITGTQFVSGLVLYNGTQALSFGDALWAIPLDRL